MFVKVPTKVRTKVYEIVVEEGSDGEFTISMPDEMKLMKYWAVGMKTYWIDHGNGNWSIYTNDEDKEDASEAQSD